MGYSTDIKLDLMATGSNSGTWGTKTNTNLQLIEEALCGYIDVDINGGAQTTALIISDAASSNGRNMIISLSGAITGNQIVTVPTALEKMWIWSNVTSGAYTVQLKGASDTGSGYTFSTTNKGKRITYMTGTDMVDAGFSSDAMENLVDDTTPQLGGDLDVNGNDLVSTSNGDINLAPNGTGTVQASGNIINYVGKQTMWVPAVAMYATTTNGAELAQTELTATNPEIKAFAFDASTTEFAQFAVNMPKNWNLGTVTYQTFWSASATDTGTGGWKLAGVSIADNVDIDTSFGTAVADTPKAASGTQDDLTVNVESGAVTIASAAVDCSTFFSIERNTGTDTNTGDLRLLGIKLFYTTNAANDD